MFAATLKAQFLARFAISIFIAAAFLTGASLVCLAAPGTGGP